MCMVEHKEGLFGLVSLLKACGKKKDIQRGIAIHAHIVNKGLLRQCPYLAPTLISMYTKCGEHSKAQQIFDELPIRTASSWNALLSLYAQQGRGIEALHCLEVMQRDGFSPDSVSFTCVLKACGKTEGLHHKCKQIHDEITHKGLLQKDTMLATALVDMYVKYDDLERAKDTVQELPIQNVAAWNALIVGYVKDGQGHEAFSCFERMHSEAILPDAVTFISVLKACSTMDVMDKRVDESIGNAISKNSTDKVVVEKIIDKGIEKVIEKSIDSDKGIIRDIGSGIYKNVDMYINKCIDKSPIDKDSDNVMNRGINKHGTYKGMQLHTKIVNSGTLEKDIVLDTALVGMYAKCGELLKASRVLEEIPIRNVVSWSALLSGYVHHGQPQQALNCFEQMVSEGILPDVVTYIGILKACGMVGNINKGKEIHDEITGNGLLEKDIGLGNALVDMYAKCGALVQAQQAFQDLRVRDVIAWNALIGGYAQQEECNEALKFFEWMQTEGVSPDSITFICILKAFRSIEAIHNGKAMHTLIISMGLLDRSTAIGNSLIDMYAKCGDIEEAHKLLKGLPFRDAISWNVLISGYIQNGEYENALKCFEKMQTEGISPDVITFVYILKACNSIGSMNKVEEIHDDILNRRGSLGKDVVLANVLIDMYAKCGVFVRAEETLNVLAIQDTVSWNSLITGYTQHGRCREAWNCFINMQIEGFYPDAITFLLILKVCGIMRDVEKGKQIHGQIVNKGMLKNNIVLGNALVDMYAKFGLLTKAQRVFEELPVRDVSSWNSLITGYAHGGLSHEAFNCFEGMQSEGISPNTITFVCILKACGSIGTIHKGKWIHDEVVKMGLIESNNVILGNALVDMYTKCNHVAKAAQVLECLPNSDVVTWSTLIAWYAQQGQGHEALTCFKGMQQRGICPNEVTFICILKACASIGAIEKGIEIHNKIARRGLLDKDIILGNALVDMYTKCGLLGKAKQVLESLPIRNAVSWNTLIAGYAQRGQGYEATKCFMEMQKEGLSPNEVTFLSILRSCSHSGLLKESECFLRNMGIEYGISPNSEHFTCMVSVLGCAGHFEEAISVIDVMPSPCDEELATWLSLLGSCSKWGNIALGKLAFSRAIEIDKGAGAAYTLMAAIFASFGLQKDAENVEAMRLKYAVRDIYSEKLPFSSFVAG